ncbi:MAG: hypothetical protein ACLR0U_32285 [Enterocloster clostridioformis]
MAKSDKALKGIKLFVSPEYENFSARKAKMPFQSLWSAVTGSGGEEKEH